MISMINPAIKITAKNNIIFLCPGFLVSGLVHGGVIVPEEEQERLLSLLPGLAINMANDQVSRAVNRKWRSLIEVLEV